MKLLFSNPPWFEVIAGVLHRGTRAGSRWPHTIQARCRQDTWTDGHYLPYPFFMGYAASYVAKHTGEEIILRDSIALHEGYGAYYSYVKQLAPEFIFLECSTPCWEHDKGVIAKLAQYSPHSRIVVCGMIAHPASGKQAEILALPNVVACVAGEYEKGALKAAQGATGAIAFDALNKAEMNAAPFPLFNANEVWRYYDACPQSPILPHAHVWASRGCVWACRFCSWPSVMTNDDPDGTGKRTVRHYTPEYMEAFLSEIVAKHRFKSIYFDDDTFNLGNKHVAEICAVMRKLNLPWSAMCRADSSTKETWKLMRDSGCYGVKLGFESGVQELVDTIINKGLDLKEARQTVIYLRKLGMTVHGTFTYGHPGETREQMLQTKEFIKSMPLNTWQESGTALLDGTPLAADEIAGKLGPEFNQQRDGARKFSDIHAELQTL